MIQNVTFVNKRLHFTIKWEEKLMEKKKIAVRLCAFSLAASLFAADVMPALGAAEPKQPADKVQTAGSEQPADKPQTAEPEQPADEIQTVEPEQPSDEIQPAEPEQPSDEIQTAEPEQSDSTAEETEMLEETSEGPEFFLFRNREKFQKQRRMHRRKKTV